MLSQCFIDCIWQVSFDEFKDGFVTVLSSAVDGLEEQLSDDEQISLHEVEDIPGT